MASGCTGLGFCAGNGIGLVGGIAGFGGHNPITVDRLGQADFTTWPVGIGSVRQIVSVRGRGWVSNVDVGARQNVALGR